MIKEFFDGIEIEIIEFEGKFLFNPHHVAKCLNITDATDAIKNFNGKQKIKLTNSLLSKKGSNRFRKLHNTGENFITESGVYKMAFRSRKKSAEEFQDWIADEVLPKLRQSVGLEAFQAFKMMDKEHQKSAMGILHGHLPKPTKKDFMKANTVANKAVSTKHGCTKMVKKSDMSPEMLRDRQPILDDTVSLMVTNEHFNLDLSVSETIYAKHTS